MFERFTERARQVVVLAQEEARGLRHDWIGTEHILLGLLREGEGVANHVMLELGADARKVRNEVIRMLSGPGGRRRPSGELSLERIGLSDALLDGRGPGAAVAREGDRARTRPLRGRGRPAPRASAVPNGLAARALADLGVDVERVARAVDEARRAGARSELLPPAALLAECDKVRTEKEAAVQEQEFARTAELREKERELLEQALGAVEGPRDRILEEIRSRLGLGEG